MPNAGTTQLVDEPDVTVREEEYVPPEIATVAVEEIAELVLQSTTKTGIDGLFTHKLIAVVLVLTGTDVVELKNPLAVTTNVKVENPGMVQEADVLAGTVSDDE